MRDCEQESKMCVLHGPFLVSHLCPQRKREEGGWFPVAKGYGKMVG